MTIQIDYEAERKLDIDYEKLASEVAEHILETENCPYDVCVNLVITDNEEIKRVNTEFRSIGAPTDVLSFPMIVAYVIELLGMFGTMQQPFEWRKILGMLIAIAGIVIFKWE